MRDSSVFTGLVAWHLEVRKLEKSWVPTNKAAAFLMRETSRSLVTSQHWPEWNKLIKPSLGPHAIL